jgi:hypothetical protein
MKHEFDPSKDTLIFTYNETSNVFNFDKITFTAICPITLEIITKPYLCYSCNNSFEYTSQLKKLKKCPMCRDKNFTKKFYFQLNMKHIYPEPKLNDGKTTMNLYFHDFFSKTQIIEILYILEFYYDYEYDKLPYSAFLKYHHCFTKKQIAKKIKKKLDYFL